MLNAPTIQQIKDQIVTDYENRLAQTVPVMPKAFIRVLAGAFAGVMALLYRYGAWVYRQIFASTADLEALKAIGLRYNIVRAPAVSARHTIELTGIDDTVIPAGTTWQYEGVLFAQLDPAQISGGEAQTVIEALIAGTSGNISADEEVTIVSPVLGLDPDAAVIDTVVTGEDTEPIEQFRDRIILRQQLPPQGGAIPDWQAWTLEVPGVNRVIVDRPAAGEVEIFPTVGMSAEDRIPDSGKRDEILEYLDDPSRRPLNCEDITVSEFTEVEFNVTLSNLTPDLTALRFDIISAIEAYLLDRFPRQYEVVNNPKDRISRMGILAIARDAGAGHIECVIDIVGGASDIEVYQLDKSELALPGAIEF